MLMGRELRSGALLAEGSVELTPGSDRALVVADARFQAEGTFEVRCANQSGRVREGFGVVGPKRATAREPDTALAALKTGKILLTHATPNTGGAVDHLIVPEV
jgi:hypothetical protein